MNLKTHRAIRVTAAGAVLAAVAGVTAANGAPNGFTFDKSAGLADAIDPAKPRNVILIIGDGTDDSMITAARNYELGAAGRFGFDELPFTGAMTTWGLRTGPGPTYPVNYVSDSAPTASGWSTGNKTVDGRISQGPSASNTTPGVDYETVLEIFRKAGKRTGNVSTAEITDATPAAAGSHINARSCQGPSDTDMAACPTAKKAVGGKGSISEQLVDNQIDVILGGGLNRYNQTIPGSTQTALQYAQARHGYRFVGTKTDLAGITSLGRGPVLGLFTPGNMTPRYQPLVASPAGSGSTTTKCQLADRGTQPSLAEMTDKAIQLLDNDKGFFLQVESAMIDKQEHAADTCGAIGDVLEMDNALKVAQAYQAKHPDTLIIVTGDHAHSTQIVPGPTAGKATSTVQTRDGDPMTIAYSTADTTVPGFSMTHTGSQIRVAASGPQAANVTGTIDQTDLFLTMVGRRPSVVAGTPGTPANPAPGGSVKAPQLALAAAPSTRRGRVVVPVSVTAVDATAVRVTLLDRGRVLRTRDLPTTGGDLRLRSSRAVRGPLRVVATAKGIGGETTRTVKVRLTR